MGFKFKRRNPNATRLENQAEALLTYLRYQGASRLWNVRNAIGSNYQEFDQVVESLSGQVEYVGKCPRMIQLSHQQVRRSA